MKIAAAAYPIDWHNRWNDYVGKLRVWVRTAAEQGAQLLVFPEYGALELASLAGEDNARDPARVIDAVTARIKDVDELHASLAREFAVHICAATAPVRRSYWVVVEEGAASVCLQDPGFPVDAVVTCTTPALGRVFSGNEQWNDAVRAGSISVSGPRAIAGALPNWFLWSPWAGDVRAVNEALSAS